MLFLPDWNLSLFCIPGCRNNKFIEYLTDYYKNKDNIKQINLNDGIWKIDSINKQPIFIRVDKSYKIVFIRNPLSRIYNIYKNIDEYPVLKQIPHNTLDQFVENLFVNREKILNTSNPEFVKMFSLLHSQLNILTKEDNQMSFDLVVADDDFTSESIDNITKKFNLPSKNYIQFKKDLEKMIPDDYMLEYSENAIKMVYLMYQDDFEHFDFSLHQVPKSMIPKQPLNRNRNPVITIITPTLGNPSIIRLKKALMSETVPFIHIILWDKNRVKNAVEPSSLEDERTFCYQFNHPYHKFPNQRNDVWLRAIGTTLTNTPYLTFFDDDTWPNRNHLETVINYMIQHNLDYTYCKRRMWEDTSLVNNSTETRQTFRDALYLKEIGVDNFEATGELNKFGYTLLDNSSIYLKLDTARKLGQMFLDNQVYGDDRLSKAFLDDNKAKSKKLEKVLVNHVAKPQLVNFFKNNIEINI